MKKHYIFVYGTLKMGFWNNRLLQGARKVGEARTVENFYFQQGGIPFLLKHQEGFNTNKQAPVVGEVYECDSYHVRDMDALEGHPNWYRREPLEVQFPDGSVQQVEGYRYLNRGNQFTQTSAPNEEGVHEWLP